jgi:transglutaminase-like putative cysteine protease
MLRPNLFEFVVAAPALYLTFWYADLLCAALARYRDDTPVAKFVKQYARTASADAQWNTLTFLSRLCSQIHSTFGDVVRPAGSPWQSNETLRMREGSCREVALLFCDVCRELGIAARFTSGYECESATAQPPYMHGWAEAHLSGAGGRGYDAARGLAVVNRHVAVAAGFNYDLASPVAGSYSGGSRSQMFAALNMQVDDGG